MSHVDDHPNASGIISDIQKFSLHDGPGIRTTVFMKGCNMHCHWCHNPESLGFQPDIVFYRTRCIDCQACYQICPTGALTKKENERNFDRSLCNHCHRCVQHCPSGALCLIGNEMTVDEVVSLVAADLPYYVASGGGVTISGGEPFLQPKFVAELLKQCQALGIHTAIESNMSAPLQVIEPALLHLNMIFCDIKIFDDQVHEKETGVSNQMILENIRQVSARKIPLVIRTPLIPGVTDSRENISQIATWISQNTVAEYYELLTYNPLAPAKYENLGLPYKLGKVNPLRKDKINDLVAAASACGIPVVCERI